MGVGPTQRTDFPLRGMAGPGVWVRGVAAGGVLELVRRYVRAGANRLRASPPSNGR
jgi:hypothetical protein